MNKLPDFVGYIVQRLKMPEPALDQRMSLTTRGQVRYSLKTPWNDGTTHVILEPLDFMARLAALVPRPRVNLTRFHSADAIFRDGGDPF